MVDAANVLSEKGPPRKPSPNVRGGLTIDEAGAFAGVTIATVRLYHQCGLVAEPEPDGSGCRRYRSAELLRLVQVRTLAGAGLPLAEIGDLLEYLSHVERLLDTLR